MNPAQLLAHFDRITEAPDALPRLRRFVLDLAVCGKLVEQEPNDEPAAELLKRIRVERERLASDGRIKNHDALPPVDDAEAPFQLPKSWLWVRFAEVAAIQSDLVDPGAYRDSPHIAPDNIESGTGRLLPYETIAASAVTSAKHRFMAGCILYSKIRPALAKAVVADFDGLCSADMYPILPLISRGYLHKYMLSDAFVVQSTREANRVAMPKINQASLSMVLVALPPLAEQHRIVVKLDELTALCDRLEAAQTESENHRDRLLAASLNRVNEPAAGDTQFFREHARFHLRHLPRLTTRPEHIKQLRQTILNLAVRGLIVPQDPTDEPAPRFGIDENAEGSDRLHLRLPSGWSWARVKDVSDARLGKMLDKVKNSGRPYRYLRNTSVHWFTVRMDGLKTLRLEEAEVEKYLLREGDVLICEGGHGIGRTAVWRATEDNIAFQKALHRVRPGPALSSDFFAYCMYVYFHARVLETFFTGVGIPHFTGRALSMLAFPLPPIAEQHRIIAKVDELMALCDRLEAQVTTAHTESRRLLEAVIHEALAPVA